MQIVRDLGGYTLGRSDLVRRAMSKKKASVMQKERQNFVYGNPEEGVPGCMANGISEATANRIYDEMTDFARYAFNKSHAACYAVVAYQTAWLKYYYPVEFMAALMTSVIDNSGKVAEYIQTCRAMKIRLLPPDINEGVGGFSVRDGAILYGLSAIRSIGRPVIEAIIAEREAGGRFTDLRNFAERLSGREVNKRSVENFIKAGAMDCLGGTRKQLMMVYSRVMDTAAQAKKSAFSGQMTLFDMMGEEEKQEYSIRLPDVGEYDKEQLLMFEKEVLGVYVSGHPLEAYEDMLRKNVTHSSLDFSLDEETGVSRVTDGASAVIGGMVESRTVKYTKRNQPMAFFTLEDLVGSVEVVAFPKIYEKYSKVISEDAKLFVKGHVSAEDEKASKLIGEEIWTFDEVPADVWIQFETMEEYAAAEPVLLDIVSGQSGRDELVAYVKERRAVKRLGRRYAFTLTDELMQRLGDMFGAANVRIVRRNLR